METKTINIKDLEKNNFILSPKLYINILPYLEKKFIFKNHITEIKGDSIKLDLEKLDLKTKLFIYDLLKQKENYNRIFNIIRSGV